MNSETYYIHTICGTMYVHVVYKEDNNINFIVNLGKAGTCARAHLESYISIINFMLNNMDKNKCVIGIIQSIGNKCQGQHTMTCIDQLARLIIEVITPKTSLDVDYYV